MGAETHEAHRIGLTIASQDLWPIPRYFQGASERRARPRGRLWVCRRGDYVAPMLGDRFGCIAWPLPAEDENSKKPDVFYDEIARLHPGVELLEMFARDRRRATCCG